MDANRANANQSTRIALVATLAFALAVRLLMQKREHERALTEASERARVAEERFAACERGDGKRTNEWRAMFLRRRRRDEAPKEEEKNRDGMF